MSAPIYEDAKSEADVWQSFADIDVFDDIGCKTAHILNSDPIEAGDSDLLAVRFSRKVQHAIFNACHVKDPDSFPASNSPLSFLSVVETFDVDELSLSLLGLLLSLVPALIPLPLFPSLFEALLLLLLLLLGLLFSPGCCACVPCPLF